MRIRLFQFVAAIAIALPAVGQDLTQDNVVVLLDASGSMNEPMSSGGSRMDVAKNALIQVLGEVPATTSVGLLVFSGENVPDRWVSPLGPVDRHGLSVAIREIRPGGKTPLGKYLKIATDRLLEQREAQQGYGTYRLLVVTDGQASDQKVVDDYLPDILSRGVTLDVIGVDMAGAHALATRVHSYRSADDPSTLQQAVAEVLAEVGAGDDDSTDQSVYDDLAGIPSDAGLAMITALSRSGNEPIGTRPVAAPPRNTGRGDTPGTGGAAPQSNAPVGTGSSGGIPLLAIAGGCCGMLILLVGVIALAKVAIKAGGGS